MKELIQSIRANDIITVRRLLDQSPEQVKESNEYGTTPLHEAAEKGNMEIVKLILDCGAEVDAKDKYLHTPLFKAVWFRHLEVVALLLKNGADIQIRDQNEHSLLHWVAFNGDQSMANLLVQYGIEIEVGNKEGKTPVDYAIRRGHHEVIEFLEIEYQKRRKMRIRTSLKSNTLGDAIDNQDLEEVKAHLKLTETEKVDSLLLHRAAAVGNRDIIQLLLDNGAEVNTMSKYGITALHIAAQHGRKEVVRILLDHGAKVITDFEGLTPCQWAQKGGHPSLAKRIQRYSEYNEKQLVPAGLDQSALRKG